MNIKAFFVDALSSALDLGIGTPDDVLRHVTPDVLAEHLPRPLWARLITACLGASRVDAQLVVETIGIPNLCEHVPSSIIWNCVADIGARALGKPAESSSVSTAAAAAASEAESAAPSASLTSAGSEPTRSPATRDSGMLAPPPEERPTVPATPVTPPAAVGPAIPRPGAVNEPLADLIDELEQGDATANNELRGNVRGSTPRMRPTSQRFRPSNTSAGRLTGRRPQAATTPPPSRSRRSATEVEPEPEADAEKWHRRDSGREIAVDDSQLVDWQTDTVSGGATAITSDDDFSDLGRKR